jgi:hypothetical protein
MNRFIRTFFTVVFLIFAPLTVMAESGWHFCAHENGPCNFGGTAEVRYGAEGRYAYRIVTNGVNCSNAELGDPAPGLLKNCFFREIRHKRHGQFCANENGFCNFRGTAEVQYGAEGRYIYKTLSNGVSCSNTVFGDPAPGLPKNCFIMD